MPNPRASRLPCAAGRRHHSVRSQVGKAGRGEAGYNLVILMVALTVMNILVAAALPAWSGVIRRDKEEELIFRGLQYAEAIRVYRNRNGGQFPTRLEDLIKAKPRCIRQLWKDPMTEDGKWQLVFEGGPQGPGGQVGGIQPIDPAFEGGGAPNGPNGLNGPDGQNGQGEEGEVVVVGPIKGVRSRSREDSFLKFNNQQRYDQWFFTTDLLNRSGIVQSGGAAVPVGAGGIELSARWIGRPWPRSLATLGLGGVGATQIPPGQPPGGLPSAPPSGVRPGLRPGDQ